MRKMKALITEIIDNVQFQVFCDEDPMPIDDWDWESEEQKQAYIKRHERGELSFYYVEKSEQCGACKEWHLVDSLHSIDAESADDALAMYAGDRFVVATKEA
jgi:hypothetical protein